MVSTEPSAADDPANPFKNMQVKEFTGHKKKVHFIDWNLSGKKLASGSVDMTARVWNVEAHHAGKEMVLTGHTLSVDQLEWDPTSEDRLATASLDQTVRIWDTRTGKATSVVKTNGQNINITWSPKGDYIAVGTKEDALHIIDSRKNKIVKTHKFPYEVNEMTWDKKGELFFLTTGSGTIEVMRFPQMERITELQAHTSNVYCVDLSPDGRYLVTGGADALVGTWDLKELVCLRTLTRLEWPVRSVTCSFDSQYVAAGSEDPFVDISSVETGASAYQVQCRAPTNSVSWHPKRLTLAIAGDDKDRHGSDAGNFRVFTFS